MVLTGASTYMVEQAPTNDCHLCVCPQSELQLPPASLEGSSRSAGRSESGLYQVTAFALGKSVRNSACPLRVSGPPESISCWLSKPNVVWPLISGSRILSIALLAYEMSAIAQ